MLRYVLPMMGLLLVLGGVAMGQDWREIKPAPVRRDIASLYQFNALLDPLADPAKWKAAAHSQSAPATVSVGEGREPGKSALRVQYEFLGPDRLEYVDLAGNVPLPPEAKAIGLWVKGGAQPLPCNLRIVDSSGETHQFYLGTLVPGTWTLCVAALEGGGHWGGDNNGKMDAPCHVASILFDKLGKGYKAKGEVTVADLASYRAVPERLLPHGFKLAVPATQKLLVYEPGQEVVLNVTGDPADKALALPGTISAALVDPFGQVLRTQPADLAAGQPTTLTLTPPGPGAYDLRLRLKGREADLDAPWADFRFAVLPTPAPDTAASPFGVSTHFGHSWPLSAMDEIARAGIKHYRDEISWGGVEREKSKLAIEERFLTYIRRGAELGLEPLIIADYANRLYDEGGFPVSAEARAGYARYAAFLAEQLRPQLSNLEIWNEWCGGCGMNGKKGVAAEYAATFLAAAAAVRKVNPQATLIGIGGEWGSENLAPMMSEGAGAAMDAFSIHPYHYPQLPGQFLVDHLKQARDTARQAAGKPVPLWITEIGWPTEMDPRGSSFLHQARALVRMMVIALSSGVEKVFWYDFKDDGQSLTYNENNFGLVHNEAFALAPKPAYVAYAHLIGALHGRKLVAHEVTAEGLWRTVYAGSRDKLTILFAAAQGQQLKVPLPAGAQVQDMFGRPVTATGTLTVTWDPVFVVAR